MQECIVEYNKITIFFFQEIFFIKQRKNVSKGTVKKKKITQRGSLLKIQFCHHKIYIKIY